MSWPLITFLVLAALALWSAFRVVTSRLIIHSAMFLALALVAVAGVFLLMSADFLAAAQVLIYVGAVTTMVIFAIMLSNIQDIRIHGEGGSFLGRAFTRLLSRRLGAVPLVLAAGFAAAILTVYAGTPWAGEAAGPAPVNTTAPIGREMFTTFLIPFEIASVVLLVAMVGAIVLTRKEEGR